MRRFVLVLVAVALASPANAWTLKTGVDSRSGVPYATAAQLADGTDETLGVECQKGQDIMSGILLDEKKSDNAVYPARDVEFKIGMSPSILLKIVPESTAHKGLVYGARLSNSPEDADRLLIALLSQKGDVVVTMAPLHGGPPRTMVFRDDGREAAMIETFKSCGIDINKLRGPSPTNFDSRMDGVWARDRRACELYKSGELDKPGYDTATLSRFGVAIFENGKFEMLASPIRCQISQSGNSDGVKYNISAQCQVKDYPTRAAAGTITFRQSGAANLELHGADFGLIQLIKCDRE